MEFVARTLGGVMVGEPETFRGLTLRPLIGAETTTERYFTLDEALAQGWATITEVSAEGVVPEVRVVNDAPYDVLVVDGEELAGARQDRVANVSALIPHSSSCVLPVSGVEPGRWSPRSRTLQATPHLHYASGRRQRLVQVSASLREIGECRADQADVWKDVADRSGRLGVGSTTGAMSALFLRHKDALEDYVRAFLPRPDQRGVHFSVAGGPAGLDLFDRAGTFRRLFPKLVRSCALDAVGTPERACACHPLPNGVSHLLDEIAAARTEVYPSIGLGRDVRFSADGFTGAALVAEGRVVHMSVFLTT